MGPRLAPPGSRAGATPHHVSRPISNLNAFYLIERNLVASAIVEFGRARTFVRSHSLGIFQRPASLEIGRDPRRAEHVTAELPLKPALAVRRLTIW